MVAVLLGFLSKPNRSDLVTYLIAMVMLVLVGLLGVVLHSLHNLAYANTVVVERFIRGAPFLAPMLFADMGTLGLIILLDPNERREC